MIKYSRQREAIIRYLHGRTDHPSAEKIYRDLRLEYPNISLGTVYRNLNLLSESGHLLRIPMDNASDRFDPDTHPHYHFVCRQCGCVEDIPMTVMNSLNQLAEAHVGGQVETHSLIFHGLCTPCSQKQSDFQQFPENEP